MTERQFIEQNETEWKALEQLLDKPVKDADKLHHLFVKVSSDLSYARTFFPNRSVRLYLNNLTQEVFDTMRTEEDKFKFSQIGHFFRHVLPQEIYASRYALMVSFFVFVLALGIGVLSSANNPDFPAIILGQDYIDMTEENIEAGDPMAVYKDERQLGMFFGITSNNLRVALLAFVLGFFGSLGTIIVLLSNGIMVGAFQYFFYSKGLFWTSFLTIWIHGTIEISAIIISGAAGIVLGNGLIFPGSYARGTSLQVSAMRALRIVLGIVPLIVIAGFLESFVTRQTELPTFVKVAIIGLSALLIILMWVVYPLYYHNNIENDVSYDIKIPHTDPKQINKKTVKGFLDIIGDSFAEFRNYFGKILSNIVVPTLLVVSASIYFASLSIDIDDINVNHVNLFKLSQGGLMLNCITILLLSYLTLMVLFYIHRNDYQIKSKLQFIKQFAIPTIVLTAIFYVPFTVVDNALIFLVYLILPPHFYITVLENYIVEESNLLRIIKMSWSASMNQWVSYVPLYCVLFLLYYTFSIMKFTPIISLITDFISWHNVFDVYARNQIWVNHIVNWFIAVIMFVLTIYFILNQYYSNKTKSEAIDLKEKLISFGQSSKVFE